MPGPKDLMLRVFTRQHWFLALRHVAWPSRDFRFLLPPRGSFLADPFLFAYRDKT